MTKETELVDMKARIARDAHHRTDSQRRVVNETWD